MVNPHTTILTGKLEDVLVWQVSAPPQKKCWSELLTLRENEREMSEMSRRRRAAQTELCWAFFVCVSLNKWNVRIYDFVEYVRALTSCLADL